MHKTTTATIIHTENNTERPRREKETFSRRIGSTTYRVGVHFSQTSRETMDEKIIRLIRNESAQAGRVANL